MTREVFVFGSNRKGLHGAGAARFASINHGAVYGIGEGMSGDSYAIPTKDEELETLPLEEIRKHVERFLEYATWMPHLRFHVTAIGCGLAGYKPEDIGPMFKDAPANCILVEDFKPYCGERAEWLPTYGRFQKPEGPESFIDRGPSLFDIMYRHGDPIEF